MTAQDMKEFFQQLYQDFSLPLTEIDCGRKCGPHHERGVPVCCDINQVVPSAFGAEWSFLQENTDLWKPWSSSGLYGRQLQDEVQDSQVLLQCQGHRACQRPFRSLTCRAFPFYPYLTHQGDFFGLGYYQDFRDQCWIISNLAVVTLEYKGAFRAAYERVFEAYPETRESFVDFSDSIRQSAAREGEQITLLDFRGGAWLLDPVSEKLNSIDYQDLEVFGLFAVTRELRFPDEIQEEDPEIK